MGIRRFAWQSLILFGGLASLFGTDFAQAQEVHPAVLVHTPNGQGSIAGVDVEFLKDLHKAGLEVDYTDRHREFTWDRIRHYNALVLYTCPSAEGFTYRNFLCPPQPPYQKEFVALVERFLEEGGGVFLMSFCHNVSYQFTKPLTDNWDAHIPLQYIEDPDKVAYMTRMGYVGLGFTDRISESPISAGVKQIWYPYGHHYLTGITNPLVLGPEWTVVVRASETSKTVRVDVAGSGYDPPENITKRFPTVASPPIFAVRSYKKGRLALCSMWPQYSFGSGKQWLYQGEVLYRGLKGKPSHFGKLLENALRWLAEPSLKSGKLGGYKTDSKRLMPLNERPEVKKRFEEAFWSEEELKLHRPPKGRMFRGLIGIKTAYSGAEGTVADYASVARQVGLDFIVIMDDFAKLTPQKLEKLRTECQSASDETLLVLPGYAIDNDIGNHMFIFGLNPPWPRPMDLTGPGKTLLNQQYKNEKGEYERKCPVLVWILHDCLKRTQSQVGYYDFKESGQGMSMEHLRTYGMGAVWFYRDGKLVEDVTDHYLLTAQGNIPPSPGAVNIVRSPDELRREVKAKRGLFYAQAQSLETLQTDALVYPHCYAAPNVFPSTGPIIRAWPECWRVHTFAVEDFVTGRNLMPSPIDVTSEVGLKEIRIYDGTNLFRRFLLNGAREFKKTLFLNGTVQRNLVLIAEDLEGGKAISYARRTRKIGDTPEFCGDRVNIGDMFMAHGPSTTRVLNTPAIYGGGTWDGGPTGSLQLVGFGGSQPILYAKQGEEGRKLFNQVPLIEAADEGVRMMRSVRTEVFPSEMDVLSHSPWSSYGPLLPSKLFTHVQQYAEWHNAAYKVAPVGHAGFGFGYGAIPTLFTTRMTFKRPLDIEKIDLMRSWGHTEGYEPWVVVGQGDRTTVVDTREIKKTRNFVMNPGDWIGVFSPLETNSNILTVRGQPVRLELNNVRTNTWIRFWAEPDKSSVRAGESYEYSFATMTFPVDAGINNAQELIRRKFYLENPTGLKVTDAGRIPSPGILDYRSEACRIELEVPAPGWKTLLTVPIRCSGMNRRWSAGLWLKRGYVLGYYGKGENRYRPLGIDLEGRIYIPVPVDLAKEHHIVAGHPVVADERGKELFIQVTQLSGGTGGQFRWWIAVNNPTDRAITTVLTKNMALPGIEFDRKTITVSRGQHLVIQR